MLLQSGHITACYSGLDTDMLLTLRRLGPKSDIVRTARIIHGAQRICNRFAWFPTLALLALILPILAHRAFILVASPCFCRETMQIYNRRAARVTCVNCAQRSCENEHISNLLGGIHIFHAKNFFKFDAIRQPIIINFVGSGNVSDVTITLITASFSSGSLEMCAFGVTNSKSPTKTLSNLFLGFTLCWSLLRVSPSSWF